VKLGRIARTFLIIFDMTLLAYIINSVVTRQVPRDRPVFWIAVAIEIFLGFLVYWFWMRSLRKPGFNPDKVKFLVILVIGVALSQLVYLIPISWLQPAITADRFFYGTIVTLLLYSSFVIDKYLQKNKV
jgi:drug/metabolite transporter (DMT)-like permease